MTGSGSSRSMGRLLFLSCVAVLAVMFVGGAARAGISSNGADRSAHRPSPNTLVERALELFGHEPMEHFSLGFAGSLATNSHSKTLVKVQFLHEHGFQRFGSPQLFDFYERAGGRFSTKPWLYDRGHIIRIAKRSAATFFF